MVVCALQRGNYSDYLTSSYCQVAHYLNYHLHSKRKVTTYFSFQWQSLFSWNIRKAGSQIDAFTAHGRKRYKKSNTKFKGVIRSQKRSGKNKNLTRLSTDSPREIYQGRQRIINYKQTSKPTVILNLMITTVLSEL